MKSSSQTSSHFKRGLFWEHGWQGREEVSVGTPFMLFNSKYSSWFFLPSSLHPHLPVSRLWQLLCIHSWNFPDQKHIHHYLHQMQKCQCGWWTYWSLRGKRWKEWLQATMQKAASSEQLISGNNAQSNKTGQWWKRLFMSLQHKGLSKQHDAFFPSSLHQQF